MRETLNNIETRLQKIVETSIQLMPGSEKKNLLAQQLSEAFNSLVEDITGPENDLPLFVTIHLNPVDFAAWDAETNLADDLARALHQTAADAGISLKSTPTIHLDVDSDLREGIIHICKSPQHSETHKTTIFPPPKELPNENKLPRQAFLIINDERVYMIEGSVVNIGRRNDNHLVLQDSRISRLHAQIRLVHNNHVIFDLNSTGGTFVNGNRIEQHTLRPGDVISVAGVPLVFGEDPATKSEDPNQTASLPWHPIKPDK